MKKLSQRIRIELGVYLILAVLVYIISGQFDFFERINTFVVQHDHWELDEIIISLLFLMVCAFHFSLRRWKESVAARRDLKKTNRDLHRALSEIKQLRGIIPICSNCKKVRDDDGYWRQVEEYVTAHSEAMFSHGLCPDCLEKAMAELEQTPEPGRTDKDTPSQGI